MASYWSSFASDVMSTAASFASDMLPVTGLIAGVGFAAAVITLVLRQVRG